MEFPCHGVETGHEKYAWWPQDARNNQRKWRLRQEKPSLLSSLISINRRVFKAQQVFIIHISLIVFKRLSSYSCLGNGCFSNCKLVNRIFISMAAGGMITGTEERWGLEAKQSRDKPAHRRCRQYCHWSSTQATIDRAVWWMDEYRILTAELMQTGQITLLSALLYTPHGSEIPSLSTLPIL